MYESVEYHVYGNASSDPATDIYLYGLSFCGHCSEAKVFLSDIDASYRWVYLDELNPETRRAVLADLRRRSGQPVTYPVLEVNGDYHFGYNRENWSDLLRSVSQ